MNGLEARVKELEAVCRERDDTIKSLETERKESRKKLDQVGGLLRTASRTHNGVSLAFRVDSHADARSQFVVENTRPSYEHVPSARFMIYLQGGCSY